MARQPRRRIQAQAAAVEAQPRQQTASDVLLGGVTVHATAGVMARLGRAGMQPVPRSGAPVSGRAYGNSVVTSDARGAAASFPGRGQGSGRLADTGPVNEAPYGSISGRQARHVGTPRGAADPYASVPAYQHSRLIARDRHVIENQGRTTSSAVQQRTGGSPNPEADGPARPAWRMFNRTLSHQMGTDSTRNLDNGQFHAATMAGDRRFPLATQGQEWSKVYGGTPGLANYRPYGQRGAHFEGAPAPHVRAQPGGPVKFGTVLQAGDPGDGPQKVYGGLPWGLHSPTVPSAKVLRGVQANRFSQVKPVRQNRPQNSKRAGQSWGQSAVTLSGHQAVQLTSTPPMRQPGMNARWLGT